MTLRKFFLPIVFFVAIMFMVFIIFCMHKIGETTAILYNYPFAALRVAGNMEATLAETGKLLPVYLAGGYDVETLLGAQDAVQDRNLQRLRQTFTGDKAEIDRLAETFAALRVARQELIRQSHGASLVEIENTYRRLVQPTRNQAVIMLRSLETNAEKNASALLEQMGRIRVFSVVLTLLAGSMLLLLIFYAHRLTLTHYREIAWRERLFRLIGTTIDEVILIADENGRIDYASPNCKAILGVSADEAVRNPKNFYSFFPPEEESWLKNALSGKRIRRPIQHSIALDNGTRHFKIRLYPTIGEHGQPCTIVVIVNETENVLAQQNLRDALNNARQANMAKSNFLSHMSHEIRTPMNAIIGMTAIAKASMENPEKVQSCLQKVSISSKHLLGLINDILDLSKIEQGKLVLHRDLFHLQECLKSVANIIMPQTAEKDITFDMHVKGINEDLFYSDSLRLGQILINLLSNSLRFTSRGGKISLLVTQSMRSGKNVRLDFVITDNGVGMSKELLERIFHPFEQASAATAVKFGGTGLGMTITQNLVTLLGGDLRIESEEGKGAVFTVNIPMEIGEGETDDRVELEPLRVLVVDDDIGVLEHVRLLLERLNVEPVCCQSGASALEILANARKTDEKFDICLLDWEMPEMDGKELAEKIRTEIGASNIVLILASSYDFSSIENEARRCGVDAFVTKPYFTSSLREVLLAVTHPDFLKQRADEREVLIAAEDVLECAAAPEEPNTSGRQFDFTGLKILLVDDNEFNREIAIEFLEMTGASIDTAATGDEAVRKFTEEPPGTWNIILMDVQMPGMNGHDATRAIRKSDRPDAASIPILAMTANAFETDVAAAIASGMNAHLGKPLDVQALYRMIAELTGKK